MEIRHGLFEERFKLRTRAAWSYAGPRPDLPTENATQDFWGLRIWAQKSVAYARQLVEAGAAGLGSAQTRLRGSAP